jgi:hypothetical protein
MPTFPLIAIKSHRYAGRRLVAGESFHARSASDAKILVAIGAAVRPPDMAFTPQSVAEQKVMVANVSEVPEQLPVETIAVSALDPVSIHEESGEEPALDSVEADTEPTIDPPVRQKRRYQRRDMTASED